MNYHLNLDWTLFLAHYWQKKPLLIKSGFSAFVDPINPDELAGLAMEDDIDSRLVSHQNGKWQVAHGPFANYDHLGNENWSILVQAVDHWHPPSVALTEPFRVLSDWRMDDLMISYSVPGGGVGPHRDQYDVFIIQGEGCRRWRVGEKQPVKEHCPHPDLLQIAPFDAIIDEEMRSGDILYIPPGFPHEGYAIEPSLNYSVGFRAPNGKEMLSHFADFIIENEKETLRYSDPDLLQRDNPAVIFADEQQKLAQMMINVITETDTFRQWLGQFISQSRHELDIAPPEPAYTREDVYNLLNQQIPLQRLGGLRVLRLDKQFFINGEEYAVEKPLIPAMDSLCRYHTLTADQFGDMINNTNFLDQLTALINHGYWYFDEE